MKIKILDDVFNYYEYEQESLGFKFIDRLFLALLILFIWVIKSSNFNSTRFLPSWTSFIAFSVSSFGIFTSFRSFLVWV